MAPLEAARSPHLRCGKTSVDNLHTCQIGTEEAFRDSHAHCMPNRAERVDDKNYGKDLVKARPDSTPHTHRIIAMNRVPRGRRTQTGVEKRTMGRLGARSAIWSLSP